MLNPDSREWFPGTADLTEPEDTRGLDEDDQGDEGAAMKSARSGASAFGIVAGAAIVSSSIGLLGVSTAEASTVSAASDASRVSAAAPNVCGQPPATTSAARSGSACRPRRPGRRVVQDPEV